ncbi:MAG: hypothetical protein QOK15_1211 [Nocardioidaceae bacterium]|nr:hypothetical protein [Nocardioidaceae bacterium]
MFRRTKSEPAAPDEQTTADGASNGAVVQGKGRPTPSRKEAEAAARAKAKAAQNPRAGGRGTGATRAARAESSRRIREGIKAGDERYLPARDKGPVRRFVRDYVDHRLCLAELAIPLLFASLLVSASGLVGAGNAIMNATLVVVVLDSIVLWFRLRRELGRRFTDQSTKGLLFYAMTRALQLRFLRVPKPQVRLGQTLPQRY